jgi:predicted Rossmann fold nucleotide-binding protein DprA/Smf involved in DNA uptake
MTTKCFTVICQLSLLTLLYGTPGFAQETSSEGVNDLKEEIEALKEGQKAIQKELQEIKSLLRARQAPDPAPAPPPREFVLDLAGNPSKGDENAKLPLVEFTDYQ